MSGGIAFPLSVKSPVAAAGAQKFTETLIKEQSFGYALRKGLGSTIKAGVFKGINFGVGKLADAAEVDIDILGKANFNYDIPFGFLIGYKAVSSIKSNIKRQPREYIENTIKSEAKLEEERANAIFCPA